MTSEMEEPEDSKPLLRKRPAGCNRAVPLDSALDLADRALIEAQAQRDELMKRTIEAEAQIALEKERSRAERTVAAAVLRAKIAETLAEEIKQHSEEKLQLLERAARAEGARDAIAKAVEAWPHTMLSAMQGALRRLIEEHPRNPMGDAKPGAVGLKALAAAHGTLRFSGGFEERLVSQESSPCSTVVELARGSDAPCGRSVGSTAEAAATAPGGKRAQGREEAAAAGEAVVFEGRGQAERPHAGATLALAETATAEASVAAGPHKEEGQLKRFASELPSAPSGGAGADDVSTCGAPRLAAAGRAAASWGAPEGKRRVHDQHRSSSTPGVSWHRWGNSWRVRWYEGKAYRGKTFNPSRYAESGKSAEEADSEALRDAEAFREELVKKGLIKVTAAGASAAAALQKEVQKGKRLASELPSVKQKAQRSTVRGVNWKNNGWMVTMGVNGKVVQGGHFKPKKDTPKEIEIARVAAVKRRRELELKDYEIEEHKAPKAKDPKDIRMKAPKAKDPAQLVGRHSGVPGVMWLKCGSAWRATFGGKGSRSVDLFRPRDNTPEAIELARLAAIECRRNWERERSGAPAGSAGSY